MIFKKILNIESRYIQLPYGIVNNRVKEKKIHLNLPPNYQKHILFDQLPYSVYLENPTIQDVVSNGINDKETLQKYLLPAGILESSIQDGLDMIVGDDRKLSNVAVRKELGLKIHNVMKKLNPVENIFKDIAKFDTQNPVVRNILKQTQKIDLNNLPSIKDIEIRERLDKLRDDRCYKNDDGAPPPGIPPPPSP